MTMLPLQLNKENGISNDILLDLVEKRWINVLSQSALKILIFYSYQERGGHGIFNDYEVIKSNTSLSRGSINSGLVELEVFGFITIQKYIKKTKVYNLNKKVIPLSSEWVDFFNVKKYREFCIRALNRDDISFDVVNEMQCDVMNNSKPYIKKTLKRLMFLFSESGSVSIEDLLREELTKMEEEILFAGEFSFDGASVGHTNWEDVLTDEEKKDHKFVELLRHYVEVVDYPTRDDVDYIKRALEKCYPYQIKMAITSAKNHPRYGASFTTFKYIFKRVMAGTYGTRNKNNLKEDFNKIKRASKSKNQTDMGFKNVDKDRNEMQEYLDNACVDNNGVEEPFDFSAFRQ